jgi:di/tricarboxylate transporter
MTPQIALTLGILAAAVLLLITERFRADLIGLLVLLALAVGGLVSADDALSGFSNPAIITVWAMFILSAGLTRTGVANWLGRGLLRISGKREVTLLTSVLFLVAAFSAFMSSVGIVVMMLPVLSQLAKKRGVPLPRLLMPMVFGTLLGGVNTLISNSANLLVSNTLLEFRGVPFHFFDFARVGLPLTLAGIAFMALIGRRLVPVRDSGGEMRRLARDASQVYDLEDRIFTIRIPQNSGLAGRQLSESRLGTALKLNVIGISRGAKLRFAPAAQTLLQGGDELLVLGRTDWLQELIAGQTLALEANGNGHDSQLKLAVRDLVSPYISLLEVLIPDDSPLEEQSLAQIDFRKQYNANVLAIRRGSRVIRTNFQDLPLLAGDRLLLQASRQQIAKLHKSKDFAAQPDSDLAEYKLQDRLILMSVPEGSRLAGKSLAQSELADSFGLSVLGIARNGKNKLMPRPKEKLRAGDQLVVEGRIEDVELLRALQELRIEPAGAHNSADLETEDVGLVEVVLSPHASINGKSLRDIQFREKYGLNVLAIWHAGRAWRSNLREMPLHVGDSLLIYGDRARLKLLAQSDEFLVISPELQDAPRKDKALLAGAIMIAVVAASGLGLLPIAIAAVGGAALMVMTRCLTMEEAQRSIQWPAVFLVAGMLPLGIALQNSGAAAYLGEQVFASAAAWPATQLIAVLFLASNLASQFLPMSVVAVLVSSIVVNSGATLAASPQAMLITIALGAGLPLLSPLGHPAHLLVMGPGGYRFTDYIKAGLPLTLLLLLVTVVAVPYFWPL